MSLPVQSGTATYWRILSYTKPYRKHFAIALIGMVLHGLFSAVTASMMGLLVGEYSGDTSFEQYVPTALAAVDFLLIPIAVFLAFFIRILGNYIAIYYISFIGRQVVALLREQLFDRYVYMAAIEYDQRSSGSLISLITYNTDQLAHTVSSSVIIVVRDSITVLCLLGVMVYYSWQFSLGFFVIGPIAIMLVYSINHKFRLIGMQIQQAAGSINHIIKECIDNQRDIKIYNNQEHERERFNKSNESQRALGFKVDKNKAQNSAFIQIIFILFASSIMTYFLSHGPSAGITAGQFTSFITALMLCIPSLRQLAMVNGSIQTSIAAAQEIFGFLDSEQTLESDKSNIKLTNIKKEIAFNQINYAYSETSSQVLEGISFSMPVGTTTALVGASGSGKTTLANLLTRMYTLNASHNSGSISIDGVDINEMSLASLRSNIIYVGQHITLFSDSVANNIAYGTHASLEQIKQAAQAVNLHEFIEQLPQGYDTHIGNNGLLLSGGQRQRLSVCRAFLHDTPIMILDEATASLDSKSEKIIQNSLQKLLKNRTTLVIAHRISTIKNADNIIVLHQGKIVEQGTHAQLIQQDSYYAALYKIQFA